MYKGFEISLKTPSLRMSGSEAYMWQRDFLSFLINGKRHYNYICKSIRESLSSYIRPDGVIDGSKITQDWFPNIDADVFISHSHADEDLAIAFSWWLKENFGISSFIDSTVWGYADELIRKLNDRYSKNSGSSSYDYNSCNRISAFVNNMLATSLSNMIDKCECLMFLNTPNSIIPDPNAKETSSPWIYFELQQSKIIEKKINLNANFSVSDSKILAESQEFKVALPAKTSHLTKLSYNQLIIWTSTVNSQLNSTRRPRTSLDILYKLSSKIS